MRTAIKLGDPTSNGGKVVTATSRLDNNGMIATIGDMASCPSCRGNFAIVPISMLNCVMPNGKQIALKDDKVNCNCSSKPTLIPTDSTLHVG